MVKSGQPVRTLSGLLVPFVMALAGTILLLPVGRPLPAWAHDCTLAQNYQIPIIKASYMNRGVKADVPDDGMKVADQDPVVCERVSSVFLWQDSSHLVEFAWWEQPAGATGENQCGENTTGDPKLLAYFKAGTLSRCLVTNWTIAVPDGGDGWRTFEIGNTAGDNDFTLYLRNGSTQYNIGTTPNLGFDNGYGIASTERTDTHTGAYGRFNQMHYQNATGWHLWNASCISDCGAGLPRDNDPDYRGVRVNGSDSDLEIRAF